MEKRKEKEKEKETENEREIKRAFQEAVDDYFRLKESYEKPIRDKNNKIAKMSDLSWHERRIELSKQKPKCINCKRPVGSIFSTKVENFERRLIALCGDRKEPCPLDINLELGVTLNIGEDLVESEETLRQLKREIIFDKNDLLFGYSTPEDAVSAFDKIKEKIVEATKTYEFTLQTYLLIVDNDEKKEELKRLQLEFYAAKETFTSLIRQYETTSQLQFISDAMDVYINTMEPNVAAQLQKKYSYNAVEYNEDDNTYNLVQTPYSIGDLEWDIGERGQQVLSYKVGLDSGKKKRLSKKLVEEEQKQGPAIPDLKKKPIKFVLEE